MNIFHMKKSFIPPAADVSFTDSSSFFSVLPRRFWKSSFWSLIFSISAISFCTFFTVAIVSRIGAVVS